MIDANERVRSKKYDASSNVQEFDGSGLAAGGTPTTTTYDGEDNATSVETPTGGKASASYGDTASPNVPTSTRDFDTGGDSNKPATWNYDYDNDGNLIEAKADVADGKLIRYRYCWDGDGQLQRIDPIDAAGNNSVGLDESLTAGCGTTDQGNDTLRTYDAVRQLTTIDAPGSHRTTSYTYDALSRVKTVTDGRGVVTTYTYDVYDRIIKQEFNASAATGVNGPSSASVQWAYDQAGNQTQLSDTTGTETFSYDELNRRIQQSMGAAGTTKTYSYDTADNVLSQQVNGDPAATVYTYDKLNLVTSVDDPRSTNNAVTFDYDRHDKKIRTTFPMADGNNLVQRTKWNDSGQMVCHYSYRVNNSPIDHSQADPDCPAATAAGLTTFRRYNYKKSVAGIQIETNTRYGMTEMGGVNTNYDYDPISRLTEATTKAGDDTTRLRKFSYTYDPHSNLTKTDILGGEGSSVATPGLNTGTTFMGYDTNDELCWKGPNDGTGCTTPSGATSYHYDGAGALAGASNGLSMAYNAIGQTSTIDPAGSASALSMSYQGVTQDRRVTKGSLNMSYGFAGLTAQQDGAEKAWFVRTPDGKLVSMVDSDGGDPVRYYLTDAQDSIVGTMDSAGTIRRYLYEPYGRQVRSWIDTTPASNSTASSTPPDGSEGAPTTVDGAVDVNPWRFASGYFDRESNLLKFGTRYYDTGLGRWTQTDPKAPQPGRPQTYNPYLYAGCDPVNQVDPSGKDFWGCAGAVVGFGALAVFDVAGFIILFAALPATPLAVAGFAAGSAFSLAAGALLSDAYESEC